MYHNTFAIKICKKKKKEMLAGNVFRVIFTTLKYHNIDSGVKWQIGSFCGLIRKPDLSFILFFCFSLTLRLASIVRSFPVHNDTRRGKCSVLDSRQSRVNHSHGVQVGTAQVTLLGKKWDEVRLERLYRRLFNAVIGSSTSFYASFSNLK